MPLQVVMLTEMHVAATGSLHLPTSRTKNYSKTELSELPLVSITPVISILVQEWTDFGPYFQSQ